MIRLSNLEDRFDGENAKTYKFDINAWAREFYIEANSHLLKTNTTNYNTTSDVVRGLRLNITEMNLAGSIPRSYLNTTFPQADWIAQGTVTEKEADKNETKSAEPQPVIEKALAEIDKEPKDSIQFVEIERAKGSKEELGTLFE